MTTVQDIINHGIFSMFNGDTLIDSSEVRCDGCRKFIPLSKWILFDSDCDVCGSHPAIACPECGWSQDEITNNKLYVMNL